MRAGVTALMLAGLAVFAFGCGGGDQGSDDSTDNGSMDIGTVDSAEPGDEGPGDTWQPDPGDPADDASTGDADALEPVDYGQDHGADPDTLDPGDAALDVVPTDDGPGDTGSDTGPGTCLESACEGLGPECGYVGNPDWTRSLAVTDDAVYCWPFHESLTLQESLQRKARLHVLPGTYLLPESGEDLDFRLPFCLDFGTGNTSPTHNGTGTIRAGDFGWDYRQPMTDGDVWAFQLNLWSSQNPTMDGTHGNVYANVCRNTCMEWLDNRNFDSCTFEDVPRHLHTVDFQGGSITLEVRIGYSMASTEPGIFYRADGVLDGNEFAVTDYWSLVYRPEHHHFARHFAVLLNQEAGLPCALRIENVTPWPDQPGEPMPKVSTAGCDLTLIEELTVQKHTYQRIMP